MIAIVLMMAVIVVIASALYTSVHSTLVMSDGGHSCIGPQVRIERTAAGWFVEIVAIAAGTLPEGLFLELKGPDGSVALERTSLSRLTPESGASFVDADSGVDEVRPGDGIALEASRFAEGSGLAISDRSGMITVRVLG